MEKLSLKRSVLLFAASAGSVLLPACTIDSTTTDESTPAVKSEKENQYDLKITTIGEVEYESTDGTEAATVLEYSYIKDGVQVTCSAIHTDGINETGLAGSCERAPVNIDAAS